LIYFISGLYVSLSSNDGTIVFSKTALSIPGTENLNHVAVQVQYSSFSVGYGIAVQYFINGVFNTTAISFSTAGPWDPAGWKSSYYLTALNTVSQSNKLYLLALHSRVSDNTIVPKSTVINPVNYLGFIFEPNFAELRGGFTEFCSCH
jgi:hypothetical protein